MNQHEQNSYMPPKPKRPSLLLIISLAVLALACLAGALVLLFMKPGEKPEPTQKPTAQRETTAPTKPKPVMDEKAMKCDGPVFNIGDVSIRFPQKWEKSNSGSTTTFRAADHPDYIALMISKPVDAGTALTDEQISQLLGKTLKSMSEAGEIRPYEQKDERLNGLAVLSFSGSYRFDGKSGMGYGAVFTSGKAVYTFMVYGPGDKLGLTRQLFDNLMATVQVTGNTVDQTKLEKKQYLFTDSNNQTVGICLVTNQTGQTVQIDGIARFTENGSPAGEQSGKIVVLGPKQTSIIVFKNDKPADQMEVDLTASPSKEYKDGIAYIATEVKDLGGKLRVEARNNGNKPSIDLEAYVLFFKGDKVIHYAHQVYSSGSDIFSPGSSMVKDIPYSQPYDRVEIYWTGRSSAK